MGVYRAGEFFQRILNVMNRNAVMYPDLRVDGRIGNVTIAAFKSYLTARKAEGELVFNRSLVCMQGSFYLTLAERRAKDEAFVYGWMLNRIDLR